MNKVQRLALELPQTKELIRFSVGLLPSEHARLEECAEIKGMSKSAFCTELITAALSDFEEAWSSPHDSCDEFSVPTPESYTKAFTAIKDKLTPGHLAFLKAHCQAPQLTSTASELAKAANYQDYRGYNMQSAKIGRMVAQNLDIPLPQRPDGSLLPSAVLVEWKKSENSWYCTLRSEVATALQSVSLN
jgi:hypothetical protein